MIEFQHNFSKEGLPSFDESLSLAEVKNSQELIQLASQLRDEGHNNIVSYSRKIFIPLTKLCRDSCHYCTFTQSPLRNQRNFMTPDEVLSIVRKGEASGCKEALFTLGDKPEMRYRQARDELTELGHGTTLSYLAEISGRVLAETSLLPHINAGVMGAEDLRDLRKVSVSQGLMLENASNRLCKSGGPHFGSPDKLPELRLETIRLAGVNKIPFTSGILVGIGENRRERIESLLKLRELHAQYGHIQEIIIQNFRAKPDTKMAYATEPSLEELVWTIAVARIIFGPKMNIQAPPNLSPENLSELVDAGINDWGGVSPVTKDHVNPEASWPELQQLKKVTAKTGDGYGNKKMLIERLAVFPAYVVRGDDWFDPTVQPCVLRMSDGSGFARADDWSPGKSVKPPALFQTSSSFRRRAVNAKIEEIILKALSGNDLCIPEIEKLLTARGEDFEAVCFSANDLRKKVNGEVVSYVVNRNINYTNICNYHCGFCAFSKGKISNNLRDKPYDLNLGEIVRRTQEAWQRGATEVCLQGGIHPNYTGKTYLNICKEIKNAVPEIHIHAFSPLEIWQGAHTLGINVKDFLLQLADAGLNSLPGTAAEILDDEVRTKICPDKLSTAQWLSVMRDAHDAGFHTTATMMYGHVETSRHLASHFLRLRKLQQQTGGFTEFVPLPFVHMEAPLYIKGKARKGPTFREAVLVHAVARLVLHPFFKNIQTSWVKMGPGGIKVCLQAGVNDLGGTLMNESITRAAGTIHGQEMPPVKMEGLIKSINRIPQERSTLYGVPLSSQRSISKISFRLEQDSFSKAS